MSANEDATDYSVKIVIYWKKKHLISECRTLAYHKGNEAQTRVDLR